MTPVRQTDRAFGLMFGCAVIIFALIAWFVFAKMIVWLFVTGGVFVLVALGAPALLLPLNRLWGAFAHRLGRVNNFVLLTLFYYLFVFPLGLVFKLMGRDSMHRRTDANAATYWQPVGRHASEDNYPDMF